MSISSIVGVAVIVLAYGCTWYLLVKSTKIVRDIDKNDLKHPREIKDKLDL